MRQVLLLSFPARDSILSCLTGWGFLKKNALLKGNVMESSSCFARSRCFIRSISEEWWTYKFSHSQGENLAPKDPLANLLLLSCEGRLSHSEVCGSLGDVHLLSLKHLKARWSRLI